MKTCASCFSPCSDDAVFCHDCGARLPADNDGGGATQGPPETEQARPAAQPSADSPAPYPPPPTGDFRPAAQTTPAVDALRASGSSPLFLIAAAALSASILLSIIGAVTAASSGLFSQMLGSIIEEANLDAASLQVADYFAGATSVSSAIFSQIFNILLCSGMWMVFATCRNRERRLSLSGLNMIRIVTIIQLVLICIVFFFAAILLLIGGISLSSSYTGYAYYDYAPEIAGIFIAVFGVVLVAVAVFVILYYAKILKTIKCVTQTAMTGAPYTGISMYLIIVNFVLAAFSIMGAFISIPSLGFANLIAESFEYSATFDLAALLPQIFASLASAACLVCMSIALIVYKGRMEQVAASYSSSYQTPGPANPAN